IRCSLHPAPQHAIRSSRALRPQRLGLASSLFFGGCFGSRRDHPSSAGLDPSGLGPVESPPPTLLLVLRPSLRQRSIPPSQATVFMKRLSSKSSTTRNFFLSRFMSD